MTDPVTRDWVWETTILLQESLRDYIVQRIRSRTLASITEAELRKAAFDSHPKPYTDGGLTKVALVAPELLLIIALIPGKEFSPRGPNFKSTVVQVLETIGLVLPRVPGYVLPALAGPAHTGIFQIAARRDQQAMFAEQRLGLNLTLHSGIVWGELDDRSLLRTIVARLSSSVFPDQNFARVARSIVQAAELRQRLIQNQYQKLLMMSPEVKKRFYERFGALLR
jgi:hypothetical protein